MTLRTLLPPLALVLALAGAEAASYLAARGGDPASHLDAALTAEGERAVQAAPVFGPLPAGLRLPPPSHSGSPRRWPSVRLDLERRAPPLISVALDVSAARDPESGLRALRASWTTATPPPELNRI